MIAATIALFLLWNACNLHFACSKREYWLALCCFVLSHLALFGMGALLDDDLQGQVFRLPLSFAFLGIAAFILAPMYAGFAKRYLSLNEKRAWLRAGLALLPFLSVYLIPAIIFGFFYLWFFFTYAGQ